MNQLNLQIHYKIIKKLTEHSNSYWQTFHFEIIKQINKTEEEKIKPDNI